MVGWGKVWAKQLHVEQTRETTEALQFLQVNPLAVMFLWPLIQNFLLADFTHLTCAFFPPKIWTSASQGPSFPVKTYDSHVMINIVTSVVPMPAVEMRKIK